MKRLRKKYLPKPVTVKIQFDVGIPANSEFTIDVEPDENYWFKIRYFRLITPPEVEANIILSTDYGDTTLLATNQDENQDEIYDASDWGDTGFFYLRKFSLYAKTKTTTTDTREVILEYCGVQETPYL